MLMRIPRHGTISYRSATSAMIKERASIPASFNRFGYSDYVGVLKGIDHKAKYRNAVSSFGV